MRRIFLFVIAVSLLWSCSEYVDTSARYVYKDKTIMQYLQGKDYYS